MTEYIELVKEKENIMIDYFNLLEYRIFLSKENQRKCLKLRKRLQTTFKGVSGVL